MYHYNTMPWSMLIASKLLEAALPCSPEVSGFRSPNWFSPPHSCRQPASNPEWMHPKDIESFNDSSWYLNITLVGGFNPSEKYESKWESSPNGGEIKKYLKPPPSFSYYQLIPIPTKNSGNQWGIPIDQWTNLHRQIQSTLQQRWRCSLLQDNPRNGSNKE